MGGERKMGRADAVARGGLGNRACDCFAREEREREKEGMSVGNIEAEPTTNE
jgi:hypothetical protein